MKDKLLTPVRALAALIAAAIAAVAWKRDGK